MYIIVRHFINRICCRKEDPPVNKIGIKYGIIRDTLQSLDVVFFSGDETFFNLIKYLETKENNINKYLSWDIPRDVFSHMGIIVRDDILSHPYMEPGTPYIFESTMLGESSYNVCNIDGKVFLGVQLRSLDEVIADYDTNPSNRIAIARLGIDIDMRYISDIFPVLYEKYNGISYNPSQVSLLSNLFTWSRPTPKKNDSLFCSEFIAMLFKEMKLFPEEVDPENIVPMDFLGYDDIPRVIHPPFYIIG